MKQQQFHTVDEDATKLSCQDSCPTLLHTRSSGRGVNLPQTHDFVTEVVFCSTSAVGRGKLIRESASRLLNKKALSSSSRQQRYLAKKHSLLEITMVILECHLFPLFSSNRQQSCSISVNKSKKSNSHQGLLFVATDEARGL